MHRRGSALAVLAALVASLAAPAEAQEPRAPGLDDFHPSGRFSPDRLLGGGSERAGSSELRAAGVEGLVGATIGNPGVDRRASLSVGALAAIEADRVWGDGVVATRASVEVSRVVAGGGARRFIHDASIDTIVFQTICPAEEGSCRSSRPRSVHLDVMANARAAGRTELAPSDLAELRLEPYWLAALQLELAPTGPPIDKSAFWALPAGVSHQTRWNDRGAIAETRRDVSVAIAARGFTTGSFTEHALPVQIDFLRVTRIDWDLGPADGVSGSAGGWTASAGYQRLSPGIDELTLWLLLGYGWYDGESARPGAIAPLARGVTTHTRGLLEQVGADVEASPTLRFSGEHALRFELDPRDASLVRVHEGRLAVHKDLGHVFVALAYEGVVAQRAGVVHAFVPELGGSAPLAGGVRLELDLRVRAAFVSAAEPPAGTDAVPFVLGAMSPLRAEATAAVAF